MTKWHWRWRWTEDDVPEDVVFEAGTAFCQLGDDERWEPFHAEVTSEGFVRILWRARA